MMVFYHRWIGYGCMFTHSICRQPDIEEDGGGIGSVWFVPGTFDADCDF